MNVKICIIMCIFAGLNTSAIQERKRCKPKLLVEKLGNIPKKHELELCKLELCFPKFLVIFYAPLEDKYDLPKELSHVEEYPQANEDIACNIEDFMRRFYQMQRYLPPISPEPVETLNRGFKLIIANATKGDVPRPLAYSGHVTPWTNGEVPYDIVLPDYDPDRNVETTLLAKLNMATAEIYYKAGVSFRSKRDEDEQYVLILANTTDYGCSANYGMNISLTAHITTLPPGCLSYRTVVHELLHILGAIHEHMRPDRDDYIEVLTENIEVDKLFNFNKTSWSDLAAGRDCRQGSGCQKTIWTKYLKYDYYSVMHYPTWGFGKEGRKTMKILQPDINETKVGGEREEYEAMTNLDVRKLKYVYYNELNQ